MARIELGERMLRRGRAVSQLRQPTGRAPEASCTCYTARTMSCSVGSIFNEQWRTGVGMARARNVCGSSRVLRLRKRATSQDSAVIGKHKEEKIVALSGASSCGQWWCWRDNNCPLASRRCDPSGEMQQPEAVLSMLAQCSLPLRLDLSGRHVGRLR